MSTMASLSTTEYGDWLCDFADDEDEFDDVVLPTYGQETLDLVESKFKEEVDKALPAFKSRFDLEITRDRVSLFDRDLFPDRINSIKSMVGDDETITSDALIYCILCILIGPVVSMIKVSWTDVGFNRNFYNYAEGWVFLPPSSASSFESVNRYHRGSGVPFVLDPVKFKNLSSVRKQSDMDRDFPSKYRNLAEAASWTNRHWPTFDLHQFALVLGIEIFDFLRSETFPFLYKSEGGCGGNPPWNNLYTAAGMLHRYRSGRAKRGIIGVMAESNALLAGRLSVQDSFFVKNLSLATSGDNRWLTLKSKHLETDEIFAELALDKPTAAELTEEEIVPPELMEKSTIINPTDLLTSVGVSYLREKGYIMTELDLAMKAEEKKRLDAVWGIVPMRDVADQIDRRKEAYHDAYLETLSVMSRTQQLHPMVRAALERIDLPFSDGSIGTMEEYYKTRTETPERITSFIYNDRVRVFKSEDVFNHYDKGLIGLKNEFAASTFTFWMPEHRKTILLNDEEEKFDRIERWLSSGPLDELLQKPFPPGVGPDDSRIARSAVLQCRSALEAGYNAMLLLVVTSDKKLIHDIGVYLAHEIGHEANFRVISLDSKSYLRYCLLENHQRSFRRISNWVRIKPIWNISSRSFERLHDPLQTAVQNQARFLESSSGAKPVLIFEYDYPNINRTLARYGRHGQGVYEFTGGYLSSRTLQTKRDFLIREIDEITQLEDFKRRAPRGIVPLESIGKRDIRVYSPASRGYA